MNPASAYKILILASLFLSASIAFSQANSGHKTNAEDEFSGWSVSGSTRGGQYIILPDKKIKRSGSRSLLLKSTSLQPVQPNSTFIKQDVSASRYAGKRMRFSAYLKTENVDRASLWMQVQDDCLQILNDDRMDDRFATGTSDWKKHDIVLDVPPEARIIVLFVGLYGKGQVWLDDLSFEEVTAGTVTTGTKQLIEIQAERAAYIEKLKAKRSDYEETVRQKQEYAKKLPLKPTNLDFEN